MDAKGKPPRLRSLRSLLDIFLDDAATPPCLRLRAVALALRGVGARRGVAMPRLIAFLSQLRSGHSQARFQSAFGKHFGVSDHPVRSFKGGFAISSLCRVHSSVRRGISRLSI